MCGMDDFNDKLINNDVMRTKGGQSGRMYYDDSRIYHRVFGFLHAVVYTGIERWALQVVAVASTHCLSVQLVYQALRRGVIANQLKNAPPSSCTFINRSMFTNEEGNENNRGENHAME